MQRHSKIFALLAILLFTSILPVYAHAFSFDSFLNIFQTKKVTKPHPVNKGAPKKQPLVVKIGVYVLHVSKYNLQDANYQMDFYLLFNCSSVCSNLNFEIVNATSSNIRLITKQPNTLIYRIQAELNKTDNLRNYPFDTHELDVIIEDRQLTNDKIIFQADPNIPALDSKLSVVGFKLLPNTIAKVTNHYYTIFQRTFSSYQFSILIERPWMSAILKGILPALIIMLCNFLALFIRVDHITQRIGIATSTLIASVVFHLNLTASIPPLGYITYADMFMFINYVCLLLVLAEVVMIMLFLDTKHQETAKRVNQICTWAIPATWFALQLITFIILNTLEG
jgi:hypothetical protein